MDTNVFHDTWLGVAITLQIALGFAYLSGLAIAHRALAPEMQRRRRR
jgi:hypothetical protein